MKKIQGKDLIVRVNRKDGTPYNPGCALIEGHDTPNTVTYAPDDAVIVSLPLAAEDKELPTDTAEVKEAKQERKFSKLAALSVDEKD